MRSTGSAILILCMAIALIAAIPSLLPKASLAMAAEPQSGQLSYQEITFSESGETVRQLVITASHNSAHLWRMTVNLGRSDGHRTYLPGTIVSFQDLQWAAAQGTAAYQYAAPMVDVEMFGLMRFASLSGAFSDHGGRTADSYRFTVERQIVTGLTSRLTCTINAPEVTEQGFDTAIDAQFTIFNNRSDEFSLSSCGIQNLGLNLAADDFFDSVIINPLDATAKPIVHNQPPIDGHPLYLVEDWYGDTSHLFDGPMIRMTVLDNEQTAARAMRPGLSFEVSAPGISLADVAASGNPAGTTTIAQSSGIIGRLLARNLPNPLADMTHLPAGQEVTVSYQGRIVTSGHSTPVVDDLLVEAHLGNSFVYQNAQATDNKHRVALTVTVVDDAGIGNSSYSLTLEQLGGPQLEVLDDPQGNPLVRYLVGPQLSVSHGLTRWRAEVRGDVGGQGGTEFELVIRRLGDINGDGFVTPTDKGVLNARLNGLTVEATDQALDVNGDGSIAPTDKGLLNAILNGVVTP